MINMNAMLLCDFYKAVHAEMLPKGITKSVSYFTPRMSRVDMWPNVVMFGLQGFIKEFLIDYFNKNFFDMDENECIAQYTRIMDNSLGKGTYNVEKIRKLHHLGYLPIQIVALKEGTIVPMHVPTHFCICLLVICKLQFRSWIRQMDSVMIKSFPDK